MNVERVEALLQLLQEAHVGEIFVEADGWRVGARKGRSEVVLPPAATPEAPPEPAESEEEPRHVPITATLVGIFRAAEPAAREGDEVYGGQPLGGIESMGILNPISSPAAGEVLRVMVADGQGVEYGQELMTLVESPEWEVVAS